MTETLVVVSFLIQRDDKALLVQETEDDIRETWCFPGGKLEQGETIGAGAKRELLEECGMRLISFGIIRIYEDIRDNILGMRLHLWVNAEEIRGAKLNNDVITTGWFSKVEIKEMYEKGMIRPGKFHAPEILDFLANKPIDGKVTTLET